MHGILENYLLSICLSFRPSARLSLFLSVRFSVRVYGVDGALHGTIRTVHTTYAAALKPTTHLQTRCRKPNAATQHLMLLMMGVCTRNMSS